jgi:hypothetical protein
MSRFSRLAHPGSGRRGTIAFIAALIALIAASTATAQSPRAHARAARFVAKICPSYDPAAMDALAAVFQRTMNRRIHNGRVQIMPIQLYAASASWHRWPGIAGSWGSSGCGSSSRAEGNRARTSRASGQGSRS